MSNLKLGDMFNYFDLYLNDVVNETPLLTNRRHDDANIDYRSSRNHSDDANENQIGDYNLILDQSSIVDCQTLNSNITSAITLYENEILKISEINSQMDSLKHKYKKASEWIESMSNQIETFRIFTTKYFKPSDPSLYSNVIEEVNFIDSHLKSCETTINTYVENTIEDKKHTYASAKNCVKSLDKVFSILKYNKYACPICVTREISTFVVPCGHTYCKSCSAKMDTGCFICRQPIIKLSPLFFDE